MKDDRLKAVATEKAQGRWSVGVRGGVLLYICAVPTMKQGDNIANIGVVASKAP